jgi:hypothetical protein
MITRITRLAAALLFAALSFATVSRAMAADNKEFDGGSFSCLNYTNGLGENASGKAQSMLARTWMEGYLAGYFKAQNKLAFSADKADEEKLFNLMLQKCREYPAVSILSVTQQAVAKEDVKVPAVAVGEFPAETYTCAQYTDAKNGSGAAQNKADIADLWAIAFIQGYKNVAQADMVIPMENKPVLTGAIARACTKNADTKFMDLTAMVADKVKLQ